MIASVRKGAHRFQTVASGIVASGIVAACLMFGAGAELGLAQEAEEAAVVDNIGAGQNASFEMPAEIFGYGSRARIRHLAGSGVANTDSFTSFEVLKPLWDVWSNHGDEMILFADMRGVVQNDSSFAGNFGLVGRRYFDDSNSIWGLQFWFDVDDTHRNTFQQLGFTLEGYFAGAEFRSNVYVPVGDQQKTYGYSPTSTSPVFMGSNIAFSRNRFDEAANRGVDLEAGVPLPGGLAGDRSVKVFAGYYHYESDTGPKFNGFSSRIQGEALPNLLLQLIVTNDDQFDTNVMFGASWDFGGPTRRSSDTNGSIRSRLGQFPHRNYNVVVTEQTVFDPVIASTSSGGTGGTGGTIGTGTDGTPITLLHVSSSAPAGGDGTLNAPFQTLAEAEAASSSGDIVYVHADSVFDTQSIALQSNQRLLGEIGTYFVDTTSGTIQIPRATAGTVSPIIRNSPAGVAAVTLADGVEVSGISIENALGEAILGDGVGGAVTISNNSIMNAVRGIDIRNSTATAMFTISGTPINTTTAEGILLTDNTAGSTFTFTGAQTVASPAGIGVSIQGGGANVTFDDLDITDRGTTAIAIDRSTGTVAFNQPISIANPNGSNDEAIGVSDSSGDVTFAAVTIDDTNRTSIGQPSINLGGNSNTVTFTSLDVTANNGGGLRALNIANLNISGGTIDTMGGPGVEINGATGIDVTLQSVSAANTDDGIRIINADGRFSVKGDGTTPGSGGTIVATDSGIYVQDAENVEFNFMNITSDQFGIASVNTNGLLLNQSTLTSTAVGWDGIRVRNTDLEKDGTPVVFTHNTVTGSGTDQFGINIENQLSPPGFARVDGNTVNLTGVNSVGLNVTAVGNMPESGPGDITLMSLQNNLVTAPTVTTSTETMATIFGQLLINGGLFP